MSADVSARAFCATLFFCTKKSANFAALLSIALIINTLALKNNSMSRHLLAIFFFVICGVPNTHAAGVLTAENRQLLQQLDTLIANSARFTHEKEARISSLRASLAEASDLEKRYWLTTSLYDEYSAYDSDSALVYARRGLALAKELERPDLVNDQELNRIYVLTATGFMDEAYRSLMRLDRTTFSPSQTYLYCDRMLFLSTHQSADAEQREGLSSRELDSLVHLTIAAMPAEAQSYCWLRGWETYKNPAQIDQAIRDLKPKVDNSHLSTRDDAINAWVLSQLYGYKKDRVSEFRYLILSAIADTKTCNKEIASLEAVADILYGAGDLDRASHYVNFAIACASRYKSRVRMPSLAMVQDRTMRAILDRNVHQSRQVRGMLISLIVALAILAVLVVLLFRRTRSLKRSRHSLHDANGELSQRVEELQKTREALHASNRELHASNEKIAKKYDDAVQSALDLRRDNTDKDKCIADLFGLCSDYITKLNEFRTNIFRLMTACQYEEARNLAKSGELSARELKQLYANFDKSFLQIYPDFVKDVNGLLRPDARFEHKPSDPLNPELRICALMRLGITDNSKIAKFLHVSVQTVYNASQRMRNRALIPREDFAATVRTLGKPSF